MRAYRVSWLFFCGVLGVFGAVVAVTWSLATAIVLFISRVRGRRCRGHGRAGTRRTRPGLPRDSRRIVAQSSSLAGAGTVAFGGVGRWSAVRRRCCCSRSRPEVRRTWSTTALAGSGTAATSPTLYRRPARPDPAERSVRVRGGADLVDRTEPAIRATRRAGRPER